MCEHTDAIRFGIERIDCVTMDRPAANCRGGERPDPIADDRSEIRVTAVIDENDDSSKIFADGGSVVLEDTGDGVSGSNTGSADESSAADNTIAPRTRRAHEESMDITLLKKGGIYEVHSESDSVYEVDIADGSCTCLDWQRREPDGGCKHLRRVDIEIKAGTIPRPDGRISEQSVTTDSSGGRPSLRIESPTVFVLSIRQPNANGRSEKGCTTHWP